MKLFYAIADKYREIRNKYLVKNNPERLHEIAKRNKEKQKEKFNKDAEKLKKLYMEYTCNQINQRIYDAIQSGQNSTLYTFYYGYDDITYHPKAPKIDDRIVSGLISNIPFKLQEKYPQYKIEITEIESSKYHQQGYRINISW